MKELLPVFKIRKWKLTDVTDLVKNANNPKIARNLTNQFPYPYTTEAGENFLKRVTEASPTQVFAIEVDGEACGGIGVFPQTDIMCMNAELGYWLAEKHWGKGIVSTLIPEIIDYTFDAFEQVNRIYARPFGSNTASQKVLEKCGFKLEARIYGNILKNGEVEDELIYACRRD